MPPFFSFRPSPEGPLCPGSSTFTVTYDVGWGTSLPHLDTETKGGWPDTWHLSLLGAGRSGPGLWNGADIDCSPLLIKQDDARTCTPFWMAEHTSLLFTVKADVKKS